MKLQNKLKALRKERGWSQAKLAEKVGVHAVHISKLERGHYQPSIDLLKKMAQVFEVTTDYLLNDEEDNFSPVMVGDKSLAERIRLIDSLDTDERYALLKIIDALLTKKKFVDLVTKETRSSAIERIPASQRSSQVSPRQ